MPAGWGPELPGQAEVPFRMGSPGCQPPTTHRPVDAPPAAVPTRCSARPHRSFDAAVFIYLALIFGLVQIGLGEFARDAVKAQSSLYATLHGNQVHSDVLPRWEHIEQLLISAFVHRIWRARSGFRRLQRGRSQQFVELDISVVVQQDSLPTRK